MLVTLPGPGVTVVTGGESVRTGGEEETEELQGLSLSVPSVELTVGLGQTLQSTEVLLTVISKTW